MGKRFSVGSDWGTRHFRAVVLGFAGLVTACYGRLDAQQMVFPGSNWETATPESVLVDSQRLQLAIETLDRTADSVNELLVVRNGRVIWQGSNIDQARHIWSGAKSFASTVLGLMIDDGRVTLDTLVQDHVPAMAELYPDATMAHFASHTSGYIPENSEAYIRTLIPPTDPFAPGTPSFVPPGSYYAYPYCSWDMMMNALTRIAHEPLEDLFSRRIADPIDFDLGGFAWGEYVTSDGIVVNGGDGWPDKGIDISASNAARLGHLFLNQGKWNDRQLLSSEWIDSATQVRVPASVPLHTTSETSAGPGVYGYGWWVFRDWYEARGYEHNYISVSPASGFVIARLGTERGEVAWDAFTGQLLNATIPAIWDEHGDGFWDEFNVETGKPRWKTETGLIPDIYPTSKAIVRSNTVLVNKSLAINSLDIESGGVVIESEGSVKTGSRIISDQGTTMVVNGRLDATSMSLRGGLDVAQTGQLTAKTLTVYDSAKLAIAGEGRLDRLSMRGSQSRILPGALVEIDQLIQTGGTLVVAGDLQVGTLQISGGSLELHDTGSPYLVTESLRLSNKGELRIVMDDDSWDSSITFADGLGPSFGSDLVIDFAATLNLNQLEGKSLNLFDWSEGVVPASQFDRVLVPARVELDLSQLYVIGDVLVQSVLSKPGTAGDFDGNNLLNANDVDALSERIRADSTDLYYDADGDGQVMPMDLDFWVHQLKSTYFGDANLDGQFNTGDLVQVLGAGKYETQQYAGWSEGDWNGDGVFGTGDLLKALEDGGYEQGPREPVAVPEPSSFLLTWIAMPLLLAFRRGESARC